MKNTMLSFAVLLLVGCATELPNNVMMSDAGFAGDGAVLVDVSEGADAGVVPDVDAAVVVEGDAFVGQDAGTDAGPGTDAAVVVDAFVPPTDAATARGTVTELGVAGNTTCVLTSTHQMWCWGASMATPTRVGDAVALEGNCAIALDGHVFCIGSEFPGTDATVVAPGGGYVRRSDGALVVGSATWTPPATIDELPLLNCGLLSDGTARCWDWTGPSLANFVNLGPATDVARAGTIGDMTYRACVHTAAGIRCDTARGTTGSALLQRGSEVDIAGGRACAVVNASWSGVDDGGGSSFHDAGVYCTSDTPLVVSTGYYPFNPLPAADAVGTYTNIVGTELHVGTAHACLLHAGQVMCWGDGSHAQLGGAATTRTPVTVF